jgi:hypothetical protein
MTSWFLRTCGASAVFAAGLLTVPAACSGPPTDEEVGKVGQACFPGDYCDPGLTCIARAIPSDAQSLGTDGGQCWDLAADAASDAGAPDADAPGQ